MNLGLSSNMQQCKFSLSLFFNIIKKENGVCDKKDLDRIYVGFDGNGR